MPRQLFLLLSGLVLCTQLHAQVTTGTISGVVKDSSGAVIPGVAVNIKNMDTGIARMVSSDSGGRYHAPNLGIGNYEIQAQVSGFRTEIRTGIDLTVGREAAVDFVLNVGEVAEKVEVRGEASVVETANAAITGLVDDKTIRELPLNGRSFDQLVLLEAGAVWARRATYAAGDLQGGGAKISISGARFNQNSFLLDGTDVNGWNNTMPGSVAGVFLGVETVREFRVVSNAYNAEFGRSAGGVITAVTRSGTNSLHGSAYEFLRNSKLDARNFFDTQIPAFKRNQFGFTVGGPVRKDKTFFFGSYEALRDRLGQTVFATVPNQLTRTGIIPINGQLVNLGVAPGVRQILDLYPMPNGRDYGNGTGEFITGISIPTNENYWNVRVDHNFTPNHSIFSRYTFDDGTKTPPRYLPLNTAPTKTRNQYLTVGENSVLSLATLNGFRFGFNRTYGEEGNEYHDMPAPLPQFVPGVPFELGGEVDVSGLVTVGTQRAPRWTVYNLFEWSDDLTYIRGSHSFKTGVNIKRVRFSHQRFDANAGFYNFRNGLTSLLQGRPDQFLVAMPGGTTNRNWRMTFVGFYIQDDYKLKPNLTLNLGLREEFMTSPWETNGRTAKLLSVMDQQFTVSNPLLETSKKNIAPRVGFAWDPRGTGKMAVSGGFGLYYDHPFPTYWASSGQTSGPLFQIAQVVNPPFPNGYASIDPKNFTLGEIRPTNYTGTGYSIMYNLTVRKEIASGTGLTVGYEGSQQRKLMRDGQMNIKYPVILDGRKFYPANAPLRNPKWGNVRVQTTDANGNYNALIAKLEKRLSHGLQFQVSYTFSKIMTEADSVRGSDFVSGEHQVMDPYDPRVDRAMSGYSLKNNLVFHYGYELPFAQKGVAGIALNHWRISGITSIASGAPFPVTSDCCSGSGSSGSAIQDRPDLAPGRDNNPILGGPDRYFDVTAFVPAKSGYYGNLGRNTTIGPGLVNFDFSLVKNTAIREGKNLEFRAELFNIFNRANFGTPQFKILDGRGNRIGDAGRITNTATASRQIQLALKFVF